MASGPPVSPSGSPRLPSPPPIPEDQTGPQSPNSALLSEDHGRLGAPPPTEQNASRRIRPGTKGLDMAEGPPLIKLADIDSAFQLAEHLKALHFFYTHPANLDTTSPIDRSTAALLSETPEGIDKALWLYELCRFLVQKVNIVIVALFADSPPCSAGTCSEMRASEWQYLCAVHDPPKSCCAIDYCCHTLDWAANTLTSPKHFPSRLTLNTDATGAPHNQVRQLTNIFRRVYRIFAHAWFSHREVFWRMEGKTGLYTFFKTVCDAYQLIPDDNYIVPPEAEGKEAVDNATPQDALPPSILRRNGDTASTSDPEDPSTLGPAATARRHKSNPSKGAPVATVLEENEDEDDPDAPATSIPPSATASSRPRLPSPPLHLPTDPIPAPTARSSVLLASPTTPSPIEDLGSAAYGGLRRSDTVLGPGVHTASVPPPIDTEAANFEGGTGLASPSPPGTEDGEDSGEALLRGAATEETEAVKAIEGAVPPPDTVVLAADAE